ncbi:Ribosomal small subunit pseudouridine synthase A [Lachnospiraceae bacterium TWA4]|nr:Ribosomal small subunit pseudouridine synthase A [Lachnospiraceae bacterium TWA4]
MKIRLDKFLAEETGKTRKQVKELLKQGLVAVNNEVVKKPEVKIDTDVDRVVFDGDDLTYKPFVYYMFHKPKGCVSATKDAHDQTILDYFLAKDLTKEVFPVGRLDKDTEGLLLVTNDGELAHRLLSPKKHVDKTYYVETSLPIGEEEIHQLEVGVDIGEKTRTLPAKIEVLGENSYKITIHEGKFHQIKRMFHAVGTEVTYLKRLSMGTLLLDPKLLPGEYRKLTEKEIERIQHES